jgi:DNA-binding GntR family transcriptional regulator
MNRLAAEGLLEILPQRWVRVAPISVPEMLEIYEIRLLVEPVALRRSIERGGQRWLAEVRASWAQFEPLLKRQIDDLVAFEQAHDEFHGSLLAGCGSEWMSRTAASLARQASRFRLLSEMLRGGNAALLREHRQLFAAAVEGRVEDAVVLHVEHLLRTVDSADAAAGVALRATIEADRAGLGRAVPLSGAKPAGRSTPGRRRAG